MEEEVIQRGQLPTHQIQDVLMDRIPNAQQVIPQMVEGVHQKRWQLHGSAHLVSVLTDELAGASYEGGGFGGGIRLTILQKVEEVTVLKQPTQLGPIQTDLLHENLLTASYFHSYA